MKIALQTLIIDVASKDFPNRPWRFSGESLSSMKALRTDGEMRGRTGVDGAPTLEDYTTFVGQLIHERLVNAGRGEIEEKYNVGFWSDGWNGLFYDAAISASAALAEDERITLLPEYADRVRFFDGLRVFLEANRAFFRSSRGTITLPVAGLLDGNGNISVNDLLAICESPSVTQAIAWATASSEAQQVPAHSQEAKFDVFISHSSRDAGLAHEVYEFLVAQGKNVFLSEVSLQALGGSDYMKAIDAALDQSRHLVLVATSVENLTSGWVEAEWRVFINEIRSGRKKEIS